MSLERFLNASAQKIKFFGVSFSWWEECPSLSDGFKKKLCCKPKYWRSSLFPLKLFMGKLPFPYSSSILFCLQKKKKFPLIKCSWNNSPGKKRLHEMWLCTVFSMKLHGIMVGMEERQWIQISPLHCSIVTFAIKWNDWELLCVVLQNWEQHIQVKPNQNQNKNKPKVFF